MTPDRRASLARHLVTLARAAAVFGVAGAILLGLAAAALAESPAPAASGAPGSSAGPAASGGAAISIVQKSFQPADLTIQVGQTVTWTVTEAISDTHSVTSGLSTDSKPGTAFDSGINLHSNGDSFSHAFDTAGTFPYFCAVHPTTMHGTITVEAASGSGSQAGPADGSAKLVTAGVLVVAIVLLFGWARLYRRMNPA